MTVRQAIFLQLCFPTANLRSDYILKEYGVNRFLQDLKQGKMPAFLTEADKKHVGEASAKKTDEILAAALANRQMLLPYDDEHYPAVLRQISCSPILLYAKGDLDLTKKLCVCVVGSRSVSDYGLLASATLGYQLAAAGACVVSGFARGCDSAAHRGALMAKGATIAVCGCGLDVDYPAENRTLRQEILEHGLLLSEYAPTSPARGNHFPNRNRILAGLSVGVAVTEAAKQSGAMITVNAAAEMGRDVYAVPNSVFDENAKGVMEIIRQGAKPVANGFDILSEYERLPQYSALNLELSAKPAPIRFEDVAALRDDQNIGKPKSHAAPARKPAAKKAATPSLPTEEKPETDLSVLSENARRCYEILGSSPLALPELADCLSLPVSKLMEAITELELLGMVQALPGRRYLKA